MSDTLTLRPPSRATGMTPKLYERPTFMSITKCYRLMLVTDRPEQRLASLAVDAVPGRRWLHLLRALVIHAVIVLRLGPAVEETGC